MTIDNLSDVKFSKQNNIYSKELVEISLPELIIYITQDPQVQSSVQALRDFMITAHLDMNNPEHKTKYQNKKIELLSAFIPTGTFTSPKNSALTLYSQIVQIDLDNLTDLQMEKLEAFIRTDQSVVLSFLSPGGMGRKVFHAVKPLNEFDDSDKSLDYWQLRQKFHQLAFNKIFTIYQANGVDSGFDMQIHDISRRCYFSHDKDCYINKDIAPLIVEYDAQQIIAEKRNEQDCENLSAKYLSKIRELGFAQQDNKEDVALLNDLLNYLRKSKKSITGSYNEWYRVIFALKNSLPDDLALNYAREFSKLDSNYNETEFLNKFNQPVDREKAPTIATILYFAKETGFKSKSKVGKGIKLEHYSRDCAKFGKEVRLNIFTNCLEIFENEHWVRFNDRHLANMYTGVFNYDLSMDDINNTLVTIAPYYDPVNIFLNTIPTWDNQDRLLELAKTLMPSNLTITNTLIRKWLIGVLAGIKDKNTYNEHVLVLQGAQGAGKTRWVRHLHETILNFTQLQSNRYFVEQVIDPHNKDHMQLLCQNFVVFYDEMSGIVNSKTDIEAFKNLMSSKGATIRKAYGRNENEYVRTASIIGTVNDKQFLRDTTGNRRFWVIACGQIDHVKLSQLDIVQVWAQIKHLYLNEKEKHYLSKAQEEELKFYLQEFEAKSAEEELILSYVHPCNFSWMTATEIKSVIEKTEGTKLTASAPYFGKLLTKHFKGSKHSKRGTIYPVTVWYEGHVMEQVSKVTPKDEEIQKAVKGIFPNLELQHVPNELLQQQSSHNTSRMNGMVSIGGHVGHNAPYNRELMETNSLEEG